MSSHAPALSIVIPVFNEGATIAATVRAWNAEALRLSIDHEILVYDDGSTDATGTVLDAIASELSVVRVRHQTNRGHGPTILTGFNEARGAWILQVDGDDEIGPAPFERLWRERDSYDFLLGRRTGRSQPLGRRLLTLASRTAVGVLAGWKVADVNAPYRLMRRASLAAFLPLVPSNAFAPNVIIVALAVRHGLRIAQYPVASRSMPDRRRASWNTMHAAVRAFSGLLAVSRRGRARGVDATIAQRSTR